LIATVRSAALAVALVGCERDRLPVFPYGPIEYTPDGYPVVLPATFRAEDLDREKAMGIVDMRVAQWVREKDFWGLSGYSDEILILCAKTVPIVVFDSPTTPLHGTAGANQYGQWIEVAVYFSFDGAYLAALPHELTHSVLLDFHE